MGIGNDMKTREQKIKELEQIIRLINWQKSQLFHICKQAFTEGYNHEGKLYQNTWIKSNSRKAASNVLDIKEYPQAEVLA